MFDTRSFFVFLIFVLFYRSCFAGWFTVGVFFVFDTGSLVPAHLLFLYAMHKFFSGFSFLLFSSLLFSSLIFIQFMHGASGGSSFVLLFLNWELDERVMRGRFFHF
ncbi:hypothetical protein DER46DRAFT_277447 [Fusarium sp. MPI-SDFR-AT-0072]|nr:hypothetical protein DER46DRAFT_277447 [Fusarium sp. MPI-SDFR-AT-0072]